MATTRIYLVTTKTGTHLVEALTAAQAVHHVTRAGVTCEAASSKDVAAAMAQGLKLEVAGKKPAAAAA